MRRAGDGVIDHFHYETPMKFSKLLRSGHILPPGPCLERLAGGNLSFPELRPHKLTSSCTTLVRGWGCLLM
jgi:hypothetical protein